MTATGAPSTSSRWPTGTEYAASVQQPSTSFADDELRHGVLTLTPLGLPASASGQNAIAFHMQAATRPVAVRCLLSANDDGRLRYRALQRFVESTSVPSVVAASWIDEGVRAHGQWWPVVVMPWVEGDPLHIAIEDRLDDRDRLIRLADRWLDLVETLQERLFAHGDYQHGNVLVTDDDEFRLVDLDGIWVPEMGVGPPNEFGHPNYQHINRSGTDWGPFVDTFSALVIALSILALAEDPDLSRFMTGESLLFTQDDFADPDHGAIWSELSRSADPEVADLAARLQSLARSGRPSAMSVREVLDASFDPDTVDRSSPEAAPVEARSLATAPETDAAPGWWTGAQAAPLAPQPLAHNPQPPAPQPPAPQPPAPQPPAPQPPARAVQPQPNVPPPFATQPPRSGSERPSILVSLARQPILSGLSCGAVAGLLGSLIAGILQGTASDPRLDGGIFVGVIAASLGAVMHSFPALAAGHAARAGRSALVGAGAGMAAGIVAVLISDVMSRSTLAVGDTENAVLVAYIWAITAALVGLAVGVLRSPRAGAFAFSGGAVAGFVGGLFHGATSATFDARALRVDGFDPAVVVTATLVSALVGMVIASAIRAARTGALVVVGGTGQGTVVDVHSSNASIGGTDLDDLVIRDRQLPAGAVMITLAGAGAAVACSIAVTVDGVVQPQRFAIASGHVLDVAGVRIRVVVGGGIDLGGGA